MQTFYYDPRFAGYEDERRRTAAGIPDLNVGRRRSAGDITRAALHAEDAWRMTHRRRR